MFSHPELLLLPLLLPLHCQCYYNYCFQMARFEEAAAAEGGVRIFEYKCNGVFTTNSLKSERLLLLLLPLRPLYLYSTQHHNPQLRCHWVVTGYSSLSIHRGIILSSQRYLLLQVNLDMTDPTGPGKLVSYTHDKYLICISSSVICKNPSYSGPSYPSSPVLKSLSHQSHNTLA